MKVVLIYLLPSDNLDQQLAFFNIFNTSSQRYILVSPVTSIALSELLAFSFCISSSCLYWSNSFFYSYCNIENLTLSMKFCLLLYNDTNSDIFDYIVFISTDIACTNSESIKSVANMLSATCLNIYFDNPIMSSISLRDNSMFFSCNIDGYELESPIISIDFSSILLKPSLTLSSMSSIAYCILLASRLSPSRNSSTLLPPVMPSIESIFSFVVAIWLLFELNSSIVFITLQCHRLNKS